MSAKTVTYAAWITVVTAVLAAISFLMLALSLHHSTRGAISGGTTGFHDGE